MRGCALNHPIAYLLTLPSAGWFTGCHDRRRLERARLGARWDGLAPRTSSTERTSHEPRFTGVRSRGAVIGVFSNFVSEKIAARMCFKSPNSVLGQIETASQLMAEHVAKAIITEFGLSAGHWHDLEKLGKQLQEEGLEGAKDARERLYFGQRVRELDGLGHALHMAEYNNETLEPKSDTVRRMTRAMKVYAEWLSYCTGQRREGNSWIEDTRIRIHEEVQNLLNDKNARWLGTQLIEASQELVRDCEVIGQGKPVAARSNATELAAASWIRTVTREWKAQESEEPLNQEPDYVQSSARARTQWPIGVGGYWRARNDGQSSRKGRHAAA